MMSRLSPWTVVGLVIIIIIITVPLVSITHIIPIRIQAKTTIKAILKSRSSVGVIITILIPIIIVVRQAGVGGA